MYQDAVNRSISIQRAVFVNQLLRAKYPHSEICALAQHFSGVLESNPKWYTTDIDRLIRDYTPKGYKDGKYSKYKPVDIDELIAQLAGQIVDFSEMLNVRRENTIGRGVPKLPDGEWPVPATWRAELEGRRVAALQTWKV